MTSSRCLQALRSRLNADRRSAIENPARFRVLLSGFLFRLWLIAVPIAFFLLPTSSGSPWWVRLGLVIFLAWVIATAAHSRRRAAVAYYEGYADGQDQVVASLVEARRRKLPYQDWVKAEEERMVHQISSRWEVPPEYFVADLNEERMKRR